MDKLLAIASIGQRTYGRWLFQRLLSGIVLVTGLTITASIMISALLISGLYAAHSALLSYGATPQMAIIIVGTSAILIIFMLIMLTLSCLHQLRKIPKTLLDISPMTSGAKHIFDAFSDGFMAEEKK